MRTSRKWIYSGITVWAALITLLRGIRLPNDWAEAHWLIDYRFGFVKRGLLGTAFSVFSPSPQTEQSIAILSLAALAVFCTVLLLAASRIMTRRDWDGGSILMCNVFFTSPFIVMSGHLSGYPDHVFIPLAFCAVFLVMHNHYWSASLVQVIALLIHESYILVGLPCVVLAFLSRTTTTRTATLSVIMPLVLPVGAFIALAVYQSTLMDRAYIESMLVERLTAFDFIRARRATVVPRMLLTSFPTFLHDESQFLLQRLTDLRVICAIVPSATTIVYFVLRTFSVPLFSLESLSIAIAALTPLAMHAIAFDTTRIWTYVIVCAFCVAWVYCERVAQRPIFVKQSFLYLACATLMLNIFVRIPLMDNEVERFTNLQRLFLYTPVLIGSLAAVGSWRRARPL